MPHTCFPSLKLPFLSFAVLTRNFQSPTGFALISWSISWNPRAKLRVCLLCVSCLGMTRRLGWRGAQDCASNGVPMTVPQHKRTLA